MGFFPLWRQHLHIKCGCFCWAPAPFLGFAVSGLLSLTKRKSGWGICGSSVVVVRFFVCDVVMWMLLMYMITESCTYFYFLDASLSIRTEPLSDIDQTGGKKKKHGCIYILFTKKKFRVPGSNSNPKVHIQSKCQPETTTAM